MLALERSIDLFFHQQYKLLQSLHPGLSAQTLKRELLWLYEFQGFKLDLEKIEKQLLEGVPLAYIIGFSFFYDANFKVSSAILIPRPETELLVARACELMQGKKHVSLVDMGCGSGAIGLCLGRALKNCDVLLSDISKTALELAKVNFFNQEFTYGPTQKVSFVLSDRFQNITGKFDLIVSNPPYIKSSADRLKVHEQVLKFEPNLALFLADEEYNGWFKTLFDQAVTKLVPGGYFLMEGHEDHLDELAEIMRSSNKWIGINVRADLSGRPRFLESQLNG